MEVYTYLFGLIEAAARGAKELKKPTEVQLTWMYDQLHIMIEQAREGFLITPYQYKLLNSRLDHIWGDENFDNGY